MFVGGRFVYLVGVWDGGPVDQMYCLACMLVCLCVIICCVYVCMVVGGVIRSIGWWLQEPVGEMLACHSFMGHCVSSGLFDWLGGYISHREGQSMGR